MTSDQRSLGPARRTDIKIDGSFVAALRAGPAGGPVALFVPGFTGSKEDFGPLFEPLSEAGFDVVAIDLPGQFESPGPDDPAEYAPLALGRAVCAVAARLGAQSGAQSGAPPHLVGHSFGGLVARAAVLRAPELFASLVLMDSGPGALDGGRRARMDRLRPVLAAAGMPGVHAALSAEEAADPGFVPRAPDLEALLATRFLSGNPAMLLGMGDALVIEPDRVPELAASDIPVLVVYGVDDDAWQPVDQAAMAARLGARVVVVPDAAHSPAIENPVATARALTEFWRAAGSGAAALS